MVRDWKRRLHGVAIEDMLHLAQVTNMPSAIGGTPHVRRSNFPLPRAAFPFGIELARCPLWSIEKSHSVTGRICTLSSSTMIIRSFSVWWRFTCCSSLRDELLVLATWQSIIVTIILPRRTRNWIAVTGWVATYYVLTALAQRARDPARKDAILALLGPVNIVGLLGTWMLLFGVGFGFVMWGTEAASFWDSLDLAGSSIFTLGFATGKTPFSHFLMDLAAASGMIVVGLQIGYLPTIYGAYSQREALVTLTSMRCSEGNGVLTGASVLRNHPLPPSADLLRSLFASWEASAAAISSRIRTTRGSSLFVRRVRANRG